MRENNNLIKVAVASSILAILARRLLLLQEERERLIEKLKKIENLSRYAWIQVRNKPEEAEELFKMIFTESK